MKVKQLIKMLKKENQDEDVLAYLGAEEGWEITELGYGDAILGQAESKSKNYVLIPIEVPKNLQKWDKSRWEK